MADEKQWTFEGTVVHHEACCCGSGPTDREAKEAIDRLREREDQKCEGCKKGFQITNVSLGHGVGDVRDGKRIWLARGWGIERSVSLTPGMGTPYVLRDHLPCFRAAFPNYPGLDQLERMVS